MHVRSNAVLILVLLLAFALRMTVAVNNLNTGLAPDEREYLDRAAVVVENVWRDTAVFRPPLYPYALALVFNIMGQARFVVGAFHALADTLSVALMFVLASQAPGKTSQNARVFGISVPLLAALLYGISPVAIGLVGSALSDTLFVCLMLAGFVITLRAAVNGRIVFALLGGILFALAALTRELVAYFALVVIPVWWLLFTSRTKRTRVLQTAVFLAGLALLFVPWIVRNQGVENRFLLLSTSGEFNFARDNVRTAMVVGRIPGVENNNALNRQIRDELAALPPNARASYAYRRGLEAILTAGPLWLFEKAASVGGFWDPFRFEKVNLGVETLPPSLQPPVSLAITGYLVAVLLFAALGLIAAPDAPAKLLLALFLLYSFVLFLLTHYQLRYRFPLLVVLLPYAAYGMWLVSEMIRTRSFVTSAMNGRRLGISGFVLLLSLVLIGIASQRSLSGGQ
jgi:4-amino-4-deoxy-L-arabinose transferase-like glycosyltransferase